MTLAHDLEHAVRGVARLIERYRKPRTSALLASWLDEVQEVEDALWQLLVERSLATAEGDQLDVLGAIVGQPRQGRDDETYRLWISARNMVTRSSGTTTQMLAIARKLVAVTDTVTLEEYYPAAMVFRLTGDFTLDLGYQIAYMLRQAKPAGVLFQMTWPIAGETFTFSPDDTPVLSSPLGFDEGTWAVVGDGSFIPPEPPPLPLGAIVIEGTPVTIDGDYLVITPPATALAWAPKRPLIAKGTRIVQAPLALPRRARAPSLLTGETIELEDAFADASLEMDETGLLFRVASALQTQIAAHEADLDSAAADIAALEASMGTAQADIVAAQADATTALANAATALADAAAALAAANAASTNALAAAAGIFAPPATPSIYDLEFNTSTVPAALKLFNMQGVPPAVEVTPLSGVDLWTQPAAGNVRIECNKANRRGWMLVQPCAENVRWFLGQKITLSGTNGWVFRSRLSTHLVQGGGNNNASVNRLMVCKDDGSGLRPALIAAGNGMTDGINFGWESDGNTMQLELAFIKTSTTASIWTSLDKDDANSPTNLELVFLLTSGSLSNNWEIYARSPSITWLVARGDSGNIGLRQGDTIWIGWDFVGLDPIPVGSTRGPVLPMNYLRVEDTAANFLP